MTKRETNRGPAGRSVEAFQAIATHPVKHYIMFLCRSLAPGSPQRRIYRNTLLIAPTGEIDFDHNAAPHLSNADIHILLQAAHLRQTCNLETK